MLSQHHNIGWFNIPAIRSVLSKTVLNIFFSPMNYSKSMDGLQGQTHVKSQLQKYKFSRPLYEVQELIKFIYVLDGLNE